MVATVSSNTCLLLHLICVCRYKRFITALSDYSSVSVQASCHIYLPVVVFVLEEKKAVFECSDDAVVVSSVVPLYSCYMHCMWYLFLKLLEEWAKSWVNPKLIKRCISVLQLNKFKIRVKSLTMKFV